MGAQWRGLRLLDVIERAGGDSGFARPGHVARARAVPIGSPTSDGPQVGQALLATHLNGERINLDHGYPIRLIAPDRAGVLNTKWLTRVEVV